MRTKIDHDAGLVTPNRGWSHSALQRARIGLDPWHCYWVTDDGAAWTLLPIPSVASPDHPWTGYVPRPEHLAALGARAGLDVREAWAVLLRHDEASEQLLALEHGHVNDDAMFVSATTALRECRRVLSAFLRESLKARVERDPALGALHGDAELGFVHLASRLAPAGGLVLCLNDLGDRNNLLRVCELSGVVFRGRKNATIHPAHRGRKLPSITPGVLPGLLDASLGLQASDPLHPYAVVPRYRVRCEGCATPFTTSRLDVAYCKRCGSGGRRVRRSRGDSTDRFVRPKPVPVDRRTHVLLIDDEEFFFDSLRSAEDWVARNVGPAHRGRRTIETVEGYTRKRAWERNIA